MLSARGQMGLRTKILGSALASELWPRPRLRLALWKRVQK